MPHDPLVLVHPFPMDSRFWTPMLDNLSESLPRMTHELPGFGSTPPVAGWSIAGAAETLAERIATETPQGRAVVAGLSMGGYVALALAGSAPERLSALVLADTRAEDDSPEAREARGRAIASIGETGTAAFLAELVPSLLAPSVAPEILGRAQHIAGDQDAQTLIAALEALRGRPDRTAELPSITVPSLVIVGDHDAVTPPAVASDMADHIPDASLMVISDAGHLSALEQPGAFAAALAQFTRRL